MNTFADCIHERRQALNEHDRRFSLRQVAYRIGDSTTNIVSPLSYYLPVMIGLLEQYKPKEDTKVGIGTVISMAMPYSIFYLIGFTTLLVVWYLLGLPLGPATPVVL